MPRIFNIRDYGARPDGKGSSTTALQSAIDACHEAGGGTVMCEAGTYRTGSLDLKSHVELHLARGCTLTGSTDLADYRDFTAGGFDGTHAPEGTTKYLIGAREATNLAITGAGTVNASGPAFFDPTALKPDGSFARKPEQRPRLLMLHGCRNVAIEGVSFVDSPCWTFWLMQSERIRIRGIRIQGDPRMINNDGIDIDACRDVTISDCVIRTDDDCIVLRAIPSVHASPAICENIAVSNCILESTCQCVRVGCPSDHVIRNAVFTNLTMRSRVNGINFDFPKRYEVAGSGDGVDIHAIRFSNIVIRCGAHPIRLHAEDGIRLTRIAGIDFSGIRAESGGPCVVKGNREVPITDVRFSDIRLCTSADEALACSHCRAVSFNNMVIDKDERNRDAF